MFAGKQQHRAHIVLWTDLLAGVHRDSSNSDFSPFVLSSQVEVAWTALDGAAVLLAPSLALKTTFTLLPDKVQVPAIYMPLIEMEPCCGKALLDTTLDDLDSLAVISAPVVDREGTIFIGDSNQFWAFEPDGEVKWKTDLPPASGGLVSAIFTQEGFVGGITMHGYAVFYNRSDGTLALPVFRLPVGEPLPAEKDARAGIWQGGLMDSTLIQDVESGIFGREFFW